jgi:hypothetical protein
MDGTVKTGVRAHSREEDLMLKRWEWAGLAIPAVGMGLLFVFLVFTSGFAQAPARAGGVSPVPAFPSQAQQTVRVIPKEIHDVLVNPGMGIQTFQRFRNQPINPGLRWSEVGPESAIVDTTEKVDFPDSSVAYLRWFWSQLEPQQGQYHWDIIDSALEEARRHGQTLDMRLMPYDERSPLPQWYRDSGARRINKPTDKDGNVWSPDPSDPLYFKLWTALVREAGRRYDGHPYLDAVDISTVGYWGEGWGPYLPDVATQKALIDVWFEAFPHTLLLVNIGGYDGLLYAAKRGAGWRADCWGNISPRGYAHMFDMYPVFLAQGGLQENWREAPVSFETCGTPGSWQRSGYDLNFIIDQALAWHASTINIKSTKIPDEWKPAFEDFQKKVGYRFVLRRLLYPMRVKAGAMMPVSLLWNNEGVAPIYREYQVAIQIGEAVIAVPGDLRKWVPGDWLYEGNVYVDDTVKPGTYRFRVGILDPRTGKPAIRLAIEGRQPDGWYDLGQIIVE